MNEREVWGARIGWTPVPAVDTSERSKRTRFQGVVKERERGGLEIEV